MNEQNNLSGNLEGNYDETVQLTLSDLEARNVEQIKGGPRQLTGGRRHVGDDVVVDGRIITAENYDS